MSKLKKLSKAGILDEGGLSKDQKTRLEAVLTDDDVAKLLDLNDRTKSDATLGPLSANTRSSG